MAKSIAQEFVKGLWDEIPPFRLVLGICPALAITTTVVNALGMGVSVTFVLVCSNMLISMLRNVIPSRIRIASYIIIIGTFVTVVELLTQAFAYPLYMSLGIFIPLIVVNCILLGRAETFASKNPVLPSLADGLGIGIGYSLALVFLGAVREILGSGTFLGHSVFGPHFEPFTFMVKAPGAFISLGLMMALMNLPGKKHA